MGITIKYEFEKPEGFNEWFSATLADCVAKGIVEKAIQRIHARDKATGTDK